MLYQIEWGGFHMSATDDPVSLTLTKWWNCWWVNKSAQTPGSYICQHLVYYQLFSGFEETHAMVFAEQYVNTFPPLCKRLNSCNKFTQCPVLPLVHWQKSIWQMVQRMLILYWRRRKIRNTVTDLVTFLPSLSICFFAFVSCVILGWQGERKKMSFRLFLGHLSIKAHLVFHWRPSAFKSVSFAFLSSSCFFPWQNHCTGISTSSYFHWGRLYKIYFYKFGWDVSLGMLFMLHYWGFNLLCLEVLGHFRCVFNFFTSQEKNTSI